MLYPAELRARWSGANRKGSAPRQRLYRTFFQEFAQGPRQWVIQRRHCKGFDRPGGKPVDGLGLVGIRLALPSAARVKKNDKRAALRIAHRPGPSACETDRLQHVRIQRQPQFLLELPDGGMLGAFSRINLAPGEFP